MPFKALLGHIMYNVMPIRFWRNLHFGLALIKCLYYLYYSTRLETRPVFRYRWHENHSEKLVRSRELRLHFIANRVIRQPVFYRLFFKIAPPQNFKTFANLQFTDDIDYVVNKKYRGFTTCTWGRWKSPSISKHL